MAYCKEVYVSKDNIEIILQVLTPTQRRRYELYLKGYTLTHIAKIEGVSVVSVWESIKLAKKHAKKKLSYLKNT